MSCGRDDIAGTKDVDGTIILKRRRKVLLQVGIVIVIKGSMSLKLYQQHVKASNLLPARDFQVENYEAAASKPSQRC